MYNINCKNCGFANPLKTEYLTFCERCGKKLPVNFQEWSRLHAGKNFEDFKKEAGTLSLPANRSVQAENSVFKKVIGVVFLVIVAGITWMCFSGGVDIKGWFLPGNTPATVLNGNWEQYTYGKYGLSIATPERLEKKDVEIPAAYQQRLKDLESYYYRPSKGFQVILSSIMFEEDVTVNLEGAVIGGIKELINQPGVANVEFKQSPLMYNGVRGMLLDGTYHENGVFMRFQYAVYSRRSILWSVMVTCRDTDKNGLKAAERVMTSIEINYFVKSI